MVHIIVTGTCPRKSEPALTDDNWAFIWRTLDQGMTNTQSLTHGCAKGVDTVAGTWAAYAGIKVHEFPADWAANGRGAGPIRNRQMVRETIRRYGKDNTIIVLAFTNKPLEQSRGTANCVDVAGKQGLRTHHYRLDTETKEF